MNGPGKIVFKNNITYEGNLKYGLLHSKDENHPSIINFPDGTQYVGTVKNNRITGGGKYTFKNGDTDYYVRVSFLYDGMKKRGYLLEIAKEAINHPVPAPVETNI